MFRTPEWISEIKRFARHRRSDVETPGPDGQHADPDCNEKRKYQRHHNGSVDNGVPCS
jgi:hypothetical protein